jgi:hypothetical protein
MRPNVLGLIVLLFSPAICLLNEQSRLHRQSDVHQMFLLRDEISRHPGIADLYLGEVACAFNDTATCEKRFKRVIAAEPGSMAAKVPFVLDTRSRE